MKINVIFSKSRGFIIHSLLGDTRVILFITILLILCGLLLGCIFRDFAWFSRFGALVVGMGITLLSRASVIREDIIAHAIETETGLSHLNPEHYKKIGRPIPEWVHKDYQTRKAVGVWGPAVSLTGTIIWAFGDLLNFLLYI
jgi:hypothetical protein